MASFLGRFFGALHLAAFFVAGVFLCVPAARAQESSLMLVHNNVFNGAIYVAENCPISDVEAANDLAQWFERVFETKVEVRVEPSVPADDAFGIYVGNTLAGTSILPPTSVGDAYTIVSKKSGKIFIKANNDAAIWGACANFLKNYLRIDFLMPEVEGAEWETLANFTLTDSRADIVPAWHWRSAYTLGLWGKHLGFGNLPAFSHNLYKTFNTQILTAHPELRSSVAGTPANMRDSSYSPQPNLLAASAVPVTIAAAQDFFEHNPNAYSFSLGINDCTAWDESPEAEKLYGTPVQFFNNYVNRSNYYYSYVNKVAAQMPERNFGVLAYNETQAVPAFPLQPNILPVLCTDRAQWFHADYRSRDLELFEKWGKSGVKIWGVWEYYEGAPFMLPREFYHAQVESVRAAHANGARLMMVEGADPTGIDCLKSWLLAQALENPASADADALIARYCSRAFGPAGTSMQQFFLACETIWQKQKTPERWLAGYRIESAEEIFSLDDWKNLKTLIAAAENAFPPTLKTARAQREFWRFNRVKKDFERMHAYAQSYYARKALLNAPLSTLDEIDNALQSPAWTPAAIFNQSTQIAFSDPRPTKFIALVHALKAFPPSEKRLAVEKQLQKMLEKTPIAPLLISLLQNYNRRPEWQENFERIPGKFNEEDTPITNIKAFPQGDWRQGKSIAFPQGWEQILYPGKNLTAAATDKKEEVFDGDFSYKFAGTLESVGFEKRVPANAGEIFAFSLHARSSLSPCADCQILIIWKDKNLKSLGYNLICVPVGAYDWREYISASRAPAGTALAELRINANSFGENDYVLIDNLKLQRWK